MQMHYQSRLFLPASAWTPILISTLFFNNYVSLNTFFLTIKNAFKVFLSQESQEIIVKEGLLDFKNYNQKKILPFYKLLYHMPQRTKS